MDSWTRPVDTMEYPHVWLEFIAKESKDSDRLVKYWIQDLPEDRFDDAISHLAVDFIPHAPNSKYFGSIAANPKAYAEDYLRGVRYQLPKKTTLVCFREGSNDIVGINALSVILKNDASHHNEADEVKTDEFRDHLNIYEIMSSSVNLFEKYNTDKYLSCNVLSLAPAYRGLNIGQRLTEAMEPFCRAFDIPFVYSFFSSDYSNHIADKVGFVTDTEYTMQEMTEKYPKVPFHKIETTKYTMKSWHFLKTY